MRLVLDTHVWLDLLIFRDPAVAPLAAALASGRAEAVVDAPALEEFARVLAYPFGRHTPDAAAQGAALARCREMATLYPTPPEPETKLPVCRDPDDQKFLELALAARADALLTKDRALLVLRRRVPFRILAPEAFETAFAPAGSELRGSRPPG